MIRINYVSWLSARLGKLYDEFLIPDDVHDITDLLDWLGSKEGKYAEVFRHKEIIHAYIEERIIAHDFVIKDKKEITFFAPIAGG